MKRLATIAVTAVFGFGGCGDPCATAEDFKEECAAHGGVRDVRAPTELVNDRVAECMDGTVVAQS